MNESDFDFCTQKFKIVLLGEGAVGKSSILLRYIEDKFNSSHFSTLQAAFATKQILIDGHQIELNIWDTAGQEKFHALGPIYYRDSQGALLVYDITDPSSFNRVKNWVIELQRMLGNSTVLFIIGNKIDLEENRNVNREVAIEYANSVGAHYQECSAKENSFIDSIFNEISRVMLDAAKINAINEADKNLRRRGSRRSIRIVSDASVPPPKKKGCCQQ